MVKIVIILTFHLALNFIIVQLCYCSFKIIIKELSTIIKELVMGLRIIVKEPRTITKEFVKEPRTITMAFVKELSTIIKELAKEFRIKISFGVVMAILKII